MNCTTFKELGLVYKEEKKKIVERNNCIIDKLNLCEKKIDIKINAGECFDVSLKIFNFI